MRMNEVLFGHVPRASIVNQPYSNISHWGINLQHFDFASVRLPRHSVIRMQMPGILLGRCLWEAPVAAQPIEDDSAGVVKARCFILGTGVICSDTLAQDLSNFARPQFP